MPYALLVDRRAVVQRLRERRRREGKCVQCEEPRGMTQYCDRHAGVHRARSRQWMQERHGYVPREAVTFHRQQESLWWNERQQPEPVDDLDPLTLLLIQEAAGWWSFLGPSRLGIFF